MASPLVGSWVCLVESKITDRIHEQAVYSPGVTARFLVLSLFPSQYQEGLDRIQ